MGNNNELVRTIEEEFARIQRDVHYLDLTPGVAAEYLHTHWGITTDSAAMYLHDLFKGNIFGRLHNTNLHKHEKRIPDVLAAYGVPENEIERICSLITKLVPDFEYKPSDVKPYNRKG